MIAEVEALIDKELPNIPGWCPPEKGKRMAALSYGAVLCVELGVFGGRGLISMAAALKDQGFGVAHGHDPFTVEAVVEGTNDAANDEWWKKLNLQEIEATAKATIARLGLDPYVRLFKARSQEGVGGYANDAIDVLHQDSNHSPEVSCAEVDLWTPKIRPGGYWVMDDTNWNSTQAAQRKIVTMGFVETEDYGFWKVYRKRA